MLKSLCVRNYRNLKDFKIKDLGRVNLITGKNNTGKSTVLEAISLYASKGNISTIYDLLYQRGEDFNIQSGSVSKNDILEQNVKSLSSIFTNREVSFDMNKAILIGQMDNEPSLFNDKFYICDDTVIIRFVKYYIEESIKEKGQIETIKRRIIDNHIEDGDFNVGLEVRNMNESSLIELDRERYKYGFNGEAKIFQFIRTANLDRQINAKLFDDIALTEKEAYVIDALKIIEPTTERIAFVEERMRDRKAVIKLSDNPVVLPLKSMGDGINRILTIILALVNSTNGYLLIDEFENGLHHSIQDKLWEIIFNLSKKLNIQVFATTHSEDSIYSFEKMLNRPENTIEGKLFRLDNSNGEILPVEFSADELRVANEQDIEVR